MPAPSINSPPFRFCGAERSYFTGKARPALRAKRLYFEEILPTPEAYREILQRTGMMFIPVVVTPEDETWQDTSDIIDALEARFPEPALIPATPVQRIVSYLFEVYADEFMLLPAMHYRWSRPESEKDARPAGTAEPPRAVGFHPTRLREAEVSRYTSAYTLWMLQRPLDAYAALGDDEREAVEKALAETGCEHLFEYQPRHRLGKRSFKLVFEEA